CARVLLYSSWVYFFDYW
nr:immunoglobulin heavy chain junction region [Macaca mulatta]MOW32620.1 immunoglobulin heavy chain junction region [Macaca mulatta]